MAAIHKRVWNDGKTVSWMAQWRDAAGKGHKKTFRRRKDAQAFLVEVQKQVADGTFTEIQPKPMSGVFQEWLADLDTRVQLKEIKPSTASAYRCGVRQFTEAFGDYRSDALSAKAIAAWRAKQAKRIEAGEIKPKTFNNALNLLHAILAWARHPARAYLKHDPLVGQKRLTVRRPEADFLEDDDMAALLGAVESNPRDSAIIHLALFCGLRRGEVFGLQWGDVEAGESGGRIRVRRSVHQGEITLPKTANSERTVDAPQTVLDTLNRHRQEFAADSDWIFPSATGESPLDSDNWYSRRFVKLRASAELRPTTGMHSLRHTYASILIRNGENLKYVSRQMGHASASFTADTYGHLFQSQTTEAMQRLDAAIPEPEAPEQPALRIVRGGAA